MRWRIVWMTTRWLYLSAQCRGVCLAGLAGQAQLACRPAGGSGWPGTAQALAAAGVTRCLLPAERFDSEGLLALPELAAEKVCGQRVVIFRGDGGRELLTDVLRERGASVERVTCYHRSGPRDGFAPLEAAWARGALDGIVVSSSEAWTTCSAGCRQRRVPACRTRRCSCRTSASLKSPVSAA